MSIINCTQTCAHQKEGVCVLDVATKINESRKDMDCAYFSGKPDTGSDFNGYAMRAVTSQSPVQ